MSAVHEWTLDQCILEKEDLSGLLQYPIHEYLHEQARAVGKTDIMQNHNTTPKLMRNVGKWLSLQRYDEV